MLELTLQHLLCLHSEAGDDTCLFAKGENYAVYRKSRIFFEWFRSYGKKATELGGNTFAFFTRNPRGGKAKEIDLNDVEKLLIWMQEHQFGKIVAHAPYTMNLCAAKDDIRTFSKDMLKDDLKRMEYLSGHYYNFHPGSHVGQGLKKGIEMIAAALNEALWPECQTKVLLETMAGKGSEIGGTFEELRAIIDRVEYKDKIGVCLDTCHIWDGGYDIVEHLDEVLSEFDHVIGLERLCAIHLNDSMNPCGAHKVILETPNEDEGYAKEIAMVKEWCNK